MKLLDGVTAAAQLSTDGVYRYALYRDWADTDKGHALWLMLNPSTATAGVDDPTIRRCQKFARFWGFDGIVVGNLFALRSTDPHALRTHPDPIGPDNDSVLSELLSADEIGIVIAAWGVHGALRHRDASVMSRAGRAGRVLHALELTAAGHPKHPLYVKRDTQPIVYRDAS